MNTSRRLRLILPMSAAFILSSGGAALAAQPQGGATVLTVPPGCGSFSGQPLLYPTQRLEDHSKDTSALGSSSSYYLVPAPTGLITVTFVIGTPFDDYIQGGSANEIICGTEGRDVLQGGGGDDHLYGGGDVDVLSGEDGSDFLSGGPDIDTLFGDDYSQSHNSTDGIDTLQGGKENDWLYGGASLDEIDGEFGQSDYADGQSGGANCSNVETGPGGAPSC